MWCAFQSVNNRGRDMKTKMKKFPKTPFKLDCGDKPEVRQWLKDNGCVWGNLDLPSDYFINHKFLFIDVSNVVYIGDSLHRAKLFNPFKKKSKLEERVDALENTIKDFTAGECEFEIYEPPGEKDCPNPVNVGRYKPEIGEKYFLIDMGGGIASTTCCPHATDIHNISIGNCYRTKEEAEQALLRQQALVRVNDRIDELNDGWVADYSNDEAKYLINRLEVSGLINIDGFIQIMPACIFNPLYSGEAAKMLISELEQDIKLAAGWEK